ncbi:hypothetical protein [Nocardia thailandica]
MTVRVGALHLGWDVVSVAAGGGGTPIRPVQVEGTYTPPAYLLADASGRLHTAGVDRQRPDLGMAIADVRDILGHPQIVIAGATWPAELVFRARLYNPLAAVGQHLRGKPDLVALPYPDDWPDEKVELYAALVEQLDVVVEPLPESIALSGYVRALGLVRPPDERNSQGVGATGIYSDGRSMLIVAVHGDDEQPTESVDVTIGADALRDARSADNVVIEAMAAARSIGADTSTVLLAGNVSFNDALRLAFQNHLGQRLHVADHPMHALVLGAAHLLITESESGDYPEPEHPAPAGWGAPAAGGGGEHAPGPAGVVSGPATHGAHARPDDDWAGGDAPTTRVTREQVDRLTRPSGEDGGGRGDRLRKLRGGFFGAPTVVGALAVAAVALYPGSGGEALALTGYSAAETGTAPCSLTPYASVEPREGIATARGAVPVGDCTPPGIDTLRYLIPGPHGADPGPPIEVSGSID